MPEIKAQATSMDMMCAESPAPPCILVIFGASGDLAHRKLIPSIAGIAQRGLLNDRFCLIGCGRSQLSDREFAQGAIEAVKKANPSVSLTVLKRFEKQLTFQSGNYQDPDFYRQLLQRIEALNEEYQCEHRVLFYLSVPPSLYGPIAEHLGEVGFSHPHGNVDWDSRLVVEKPFGHDLASATELNETISQCFKESQVYRIDHYMGKETVQNILMFRFANAIFEPIWNRSYIDHVQVTIAESLGVGERGGYYDGSGALRDMFQNHLLQMLALVTMEPPASFAADSVRDEKRKLLEALRPIDLKTLNQTFLRGQYAAQGDQPGYLQESGVNPESTTETLVAAKLWIDNWRWKDVPFYLRTGKALAAKTTEVVVTFKQVPHSMFSSAGFDDIPPNVLVMQIQPQEGINLSFQAKRPGSKLCMGTLNMHFSYEQVFGVQMPEAYERLLLDCMLGDQTLFMRFDNLDTAWRLLDPVLQQWSESETKPIPYPHSCNSFAELDHLIEADGRQWCKMQ